MRMTEAMRERWYRLQAWQSARRGHDEARSLGQTTAEYALVLLGAATVALLLITWVSHSGKIGELFDSVFDHVIKSVK